MLMVLLMSEIMKHDPTLVDSLIEDGTVAIALSVFSVEEWPSQQNRGFVFAYPSIMHTLFTTAKGRDVMYAFEPFHGILEKLANPKCVQAFHEFDRNESSKLLGQQMLEVLGARNTSVLRKQAIHASLASIKRMIDVGIESLSSGTTKSLTDLQRSEDERLYLCKQTLEFLCKLLERKSEAELFMEREPDQGHGFGLLLELYQYTLVHPRLSESPNVKFSPRMQSASFALTKLVKMLVKRCGAQELKSLHTLMGVTWGHLKGEGPLKQDNSVAAPTYKTVSVQDIPMYLHRLTVLQWYIKTLDLVTFAVRKHKQTYWGMRLLDVDLGEVEPLPLGVLVGEVFKFASDNRGGEFLMCGRNKEDTRDMQYLKPASLKKLVDARQMSFWLTASNWLVRLNTLSQSVGQKLSHIEDSFEENMVALWKKDILSAHDEIDKIMAECLVYEAVNVLTTRGKVLSYGVVGLSSSVDKEETAIDVATTSVESPKNEETSTKTEPTKEDLTTNPALNMGTHKMLHMGEFLLLCLEMVRNKNTGSEDKVHKSYIYTAMDGVLTHVLDFLLTQETYFSEEEVQGCYQSLIALLSYLFEETHKVSKFKTLSLEDIAYYRGLHVKLCEMVVTLLKSDVHRKVLGEDYTYVLVDFATDLSAPLSFARQAAKTSSSSMNEVEEDGQSNPPVDNTEVVEILVSMGFQEALVKQALNETESNDPQVLIEYMTHTDFDPDLAIAMELSRTESEEHKDEDQRKKEEEERKKEEEERKKEEEERKEEEALKKKLELAEAKEVEEAAKYIEVMKAHLTYFMTSMLDLVKAQANLVVNKKLGMLVASFVNVRLCHVEEHPVRTPAVAPLWGDAFTPLQMVLPLFLTQLTTLCSVANATAMYVVSSVANLVLDCETQIEDLVLQASKERPCVDMLLDKLSRRENTANCLSTLYALSFSLKGPSCFSETQALSLLEVCLALLEEELPFDDLFTCLRMIKALLRDRFAEYQFHRLKGKTIRVQDEPGTWRVGQMEESTDYLLSKVDHPQTHLILQATSEYVLAEADPEEEAIQQRSRDTAAKCTKFFLDSRGESKTILARVETTDEDVSYSGVADMVYSILEQVLVSDASMLKHLLTCFVVSQFRRLESKKGEVRLWDLSESIADAYPRLNEGNVKDHLKGLLQLEILKPIVGECHNCGETDIKLEAWLDKNQCCHECALKNKASVLDPNVLVTLNAEEAKNPIPEHLQGLMTNTVTLLVQVYRQSLPLVAQPYNNPFMCKPDVTLGVLQRVFATFPWSVQILQHLTLPAPSEEERLYVSLPFCIDPLPSMVSPTHARRSSSQESSLSTYAPGSSKKLRQSSKKGERRSSRKSTSSSSSKKRKRKSKISSHSPTPKKLKAIPRPVSFWGLMFHSLLKVEGAQQIFQAVHGMVLQISGHSKEQRRLIINELVYAIKVYPVVCHASEDYKPLDALLRLLGVLLAFEDESGKHMPVAWDLILAMHEAGTLQVLFSTLHSLDLANQSVAKTTKLLLRPIELLTMKVVWDRLHGKNSKEESDKITLVKQHSSDEADKLIQSLAIQVVQELQDGINDDEDEMMEESSGTEGSSMDEDDDEVEYMDDDANNHGSDEDSYSSSSSSSSDDMEEDHLAYGVAHEEQDWDMADMAPFDEEEFIHVNMDDSNTRMRMGGQGQGFPFADVDDDEIFQDSFSGFLEAFRLNVGGMDEGLPIEFEPAEDHIMHNERQRGRSLVLPEDSDGSRPSMWNRSWYSVPGTNQHTHQFLVMYSSRTKIFLKSLLEACTHGIAIIPPMLEEFKFGVRYKYKGVGEDHVSPSRLPQFKARGVVDNPFRELTQLILDECLEGATVRMEEEDLEKDQGKEDDGGEGEKVEVDQQDSNSVPTTQGIGSVEEETQTTEVVETQTTEEEVVGESSTIEVTSSQPVEEISDETSQPVEEISDETSQPVEETTNETSQPVDGRSDETSSQPMEETEEGTTSQTSTITPQETSPPQPPPTAPTLFDPNSSLSMEEQDAFLASLPESIREEMLAERARVVQEEEALLARSAQGGDDMDVASFIATLDDASLRSEVLLSLSEAELATLPDQLRAEVQVMHQRERRPRRGGIVAASSEVYNGQPNSEQRGDKSSMLQKTACPPRFVFVGEELGQPLEGVSEQDIQNLVRLVFLTKPMDVKTLWPTLENLCLYPNSRAWLLHALLQVVLPHKVSQWIPAQIMGSASSWLFSSQKVDTDEFVAPAIVLKRVLKMIKKIVSSNPMSRVFVFEVYLGRLIGLLQHRQHLNTTHSTLLVEIISLLVSPMQYLGDTSPFPESLERTQYWEAQPQVLSKSVLSELVTTLSMDSCSNDLFELVGGIISNLACVDANAEALVNDLCLAASSLSRRVVEDLKALHSRLVHFGEHKGNLSSWAFNTSSNESKLLRVIKSIKHIHKEGKEEDLVTRAMTPSRPVSRLGSTSSSLVNTRVQQQASPLPTVRNNNLTATSINNPTASINNTSTQVQSPTRSTSSSNHSIRAFSFPNLSLLWLTVVKCFSVLDKGGGEEGHAHAVSVAQRLLPMVEAFSIVAPTSDALLDENADLEEEHDMYEDEDTPVASSVVEKFFKKFKRVFNRVVQSSPGILEHGLRCMVEDRSLSHYLSFANKRSFFKAMVKKHGHGSRQLHGHVRLTVRREHVFKDSYLQVMAHSPEELKGKLNISFQGEAGIDAGGVSREWFAVLSRAVFDPRYCLFMPSADSTAFQPDPRSTYQDDYERYFQFVGRIVGKALADGHLMDAHFTRPFYKQMLGLQVTYRDMQSLDPKYYKNLMYMVEHSVEDLMLELCFDVQFEQFGKQVTLELIPGGSSIAVTDENKMMYIQLLTQHKMIVGIKKQIDAFLLGFKEILPEDHLQVFTPSELELVICGIPEIDVADWKANTTYGSTYTDKSPQVEWFWEFVQGLDKEDLASLLMFVTGTSKVPLEGFKALVGMRGLQKFSIHPCDAKQDTCLATSHTCFNQLDLPKYSSKEVLVEKILLSIREGGEGFLLS